MIDWNTTMTLCHVHVDWDVEDKVKFDREEIDAYEVFEYRSTLLRVPTQSVIDPEILSMQFQPRQTNVHPISNHIHHSLDRLLLS